MRDRILPPSKISSSCQSDYLYINSFVIVTTYFNKHNPFSGHRFVYAILKLSFSKQCKI